jgi:hypothetical protein
VLLLKRPHGCDHQRGRRRDVIFAVSEPVRAADTEVGGVRVPFLAPLTVLVSSPHCSLAGRR